MDSPSPSKWDSISMWDSGLSTSFLASHLHSRVSKGERSILSSYEKIRRENIRISGGSSELKIGSWLCRVAFLLKKESKGSSPSLLNMQEIKEERRSPCIRSEERRVGKECRSRWS